MSFQDTLNKVSVKKGKVRILSAHCRKGPYAFSVPPVTPRTRGFHGTYGWITVVAKSNGEPLRPARTTDETYTFIHEDILLLRVEFNLLLKKGEFKAVLLRGKKGGELVVVPIEYPEPVSFSEATYKWHPATIFVPLIEAGIQAIREYAGHLVLSAS